VAVAIGEQAARSEPTSSRLSMDRDRDIELFLFSVLEMSSGAMSIWSTWGPHCVGGTFLALTFTHCWPLRLHGWFCYWLPMSETGLLRRHCTPFLNACGSFSDHTSFFNADIQGI